MFLYSEEVTECQRVRNEHVLVVHSPVLSHRLGFRAIFLFLDAHEVSQFGPSELPVFVLRLFQ